MRLIGRIERRAEGTAGSVERRAWPRSVAVIVRLSPQEINLSLEQAQAIGVP
jgi:hypothetical protein